MMMYLCIVRPAVAHHSKRTCALGNIDCWQAAIVHYTDACCGAAAIAKTGVDGAVKPPTSGPHLVRRLSRDNPLRGASRMHGEVLSVGLVASQVTLAKDAQEHVSDAQTVERK